MATKTNERRITAKCPTCQHYGEDCHCHETPLPKETILHLLERWIAQRPGLEFANYGDASSYRSELRRITSMRHDAEQMLRFVALRESITASMLTEGFRAFSGRLSIVQDAKGAHLDYCAGQYWPTEYRAAACAVLASAIWHWTSNNYVQSRRDVGKTDADDYAESYPYGAKIRAELKREFGARMQKKWFD